MYYAGIINHRQHKKGLLLVIANTLVIDSYKHVFHMIRSNVSVKLFIKTDCNTGF